MDYHTWYLDKEAAKRRGPSEEDCSELLMVGYILPYGWQTMNWLSTDRLVLLSQRLIESSR